MTATHPSLRLDDVKTAHRALWSAGDYAMVADTVIPQLGQTLVDACAPLAGHRVLDLACGAGNAALPAARRGGRVTAADLCDSLLNTCARRAEQERLDVTCVPADAESLPFDDAHFDTVLSCVGVMFVPNHQQAADELLRVCRPGGTVGLLSWTPAGFIGQLLAAMSPFVPTPAPGTQPPVRWADPQHVRDLVGGRLGPLSVRTDTVRVTCFEDPIGFRRLFASSYGPIITAYARLAGDADRTRALDAALDGLAREHWLPDGTMEWEYAIVTASRREGSAAPAASGRGAADRTAGQAVCTGHPLY